METANKINLIPTKAEVSPQVEAAILVLRKLSLLALVALIVCSVIAGGFFYFFKARQEQLVGKKQQLLAMISQDTIKEGLLISLKQRTGLTKKILDIQRPVGNLLNTLAAFSTSDQITSVSLDETDNVTMTVHAQSIADVITVTDALIKLTEENRVKAPKLASFALGEGGSIEIGLSFTVVL